MLRFSLGLMFVFRKAKSFFALGQPSQFDIAYMKNNDIKPTEGMPSVNCSNCSSPTERSQSPVSEEVGMGRYRIMYWMRMTFLALVLIAMAFVALMLCRDYLKFLLLWMEGLNLYAATVLFAVLFTLVSFPMTWGYIVLNVAAGYLYGVTLGTIIVIICAFIGVLVAHELTKRFLNEYMISRVSSGLGGNDGLRAILRVIEGGRAFKVIALARLTPIPFGFQNGIFAISNVSRVKYMTATSVGCLPTQILNCYIGSTLRSMEEVFKDTKSATAYIVFIGQLLLTFALMAYVVRRARREFNKTMEELDAPPVTTPYTDEKGSVDVFVESGTYRNGTVTRHLSKVDLINENDILPDKPGS